ncbi:hypothetical protein RugamoR57_37420 [Duganella caerulea]|uniref:hypothetical protein n=1 Tax=Duganella caerulea TaxID=2885762 RepID=UPI0030EAFDBE
MNATFVFGFIAYVINFAAVVYVLGRTAQHTQRYLTGHGKQLRTMLLVKFIAAVSFALVAVLREDKLDEYSLPAGLAAFLAAAALGASPHGAITAMVLAICLFNYVRPVSLKSLVL